MLLGEDIEKNSIIYVDNVGNAVKANWDFFTSSLGVGVALESVLSGGSFSVHVQHGGIVSGFSGLQKGARYFLSSSGKITTAPVVGKNVYQIGFAKTNADLIFYPELVLKSSF